jgi:CRISPR-associated endonuclease/helicase Cas3
LESVAIDTEGAALAATGLAHRNLLNPRFDYADAQNVFDDDYFPTRLGEKQMTLVLTRRTALGLALWSDDTDPPRARALSEVQMSFRKYQHGPLPNMQSSPEIASFIEGWKDWQRATAAIAIVDDNGTICAGLSYSRDTGLLIGQDF